MSSHSVQFGRHRNDIATTMAGPSPCACMGCDVICCHLTFCCCFWSVGLCYLNCALFVSQPNKLAKKSSSFLHLVPSPPHPWHFSFVCLSLFYCWCFFFIVFWILFEFGFIFFFHLACYCTAVLMSWSVFSVTGKQLSLIKKKPKRLVKQTKLCQEQIIPIGAMGSSQVAARSFSMACLARGVTLRRESQECY